MKQEIRSRRLFETAHKLKKLNLHETVSLMPKGEFFTLGTILKCSNDPVDRELRVGDIVNKMKVSSPAVSRNLRGLEKKGYIKRVTNEADRRNTNIIVTQKGKSAFYSDMSSMSEFMEQALSHLDEDEIDTFISLLNKITDGMEEELLKIKSKEQ